MPRFIIIVEDESGLQWREPYDKPVPDPKAWAEDVIASFNSTLRAGETERKLISVEVVGESQEHQWEKSNLVTIIGRGETLYDTARCLRCGMTGRRYGLGGVVTRDRAYKAKKYAKCGGVQLPVKDRVFA